MAPTVYFLLLAWLGQCSTNHSQSASAQLFYQVLSPCFPTTKSPPGVNSDDEEEEEEADFSWPTQDPGSQDGRQEGSWRGADEDIW